MRRTLIFISVQFENVTRKLGFDFLETNTEGDGCERGDRFGGHRVGCHQHTDGN